MSKYAVIEVINELGAVEAEVLEADIETIDVAEKLRYEYLIEFPDINPNNVFVADYTLSSN